MSEWTKDAENHYIVWNQAPQTVHGVVNLLLPGERSITDAEMSKRRREFMKLQLRDLKRRKNDGPRP